jgi:hypothetical protein
LAAPRRASGSHHSGEGRRGRPGPARGPARRLFDRGRRSARGPKFPTVRNFAKFADFRGLRSKFDTVAHFHSRRGEPDRRATRPLRAPIGQGWLASPRTKPDKRIRLRSRARRGGSSLQFLNTSGLLGHVLAFRGLAETPGGPLGAGPAPFRRRNLTLNLRIMSGAGLVWKRRPSPLRDLFREPVALLGANSGFHDRQQHLCAIAGGAGRLSEPHVALKIAQQLAQRLDPATQFGHRGA